MNSKNDAKPSIAAIQWRNLAEGLGWEGTPAELGAGLARLKQRAAYRRGRYDEVPTLLPGDVRLVSGRGERDADEVDYCGA